MLTPRSRGTYLAITHLRGHFSNVYSITIAYEQSRKPPTDKAKQWSRSEAPGVVKFLLSYSPKLHIHIKKIGADAVPEKEEEVASWLHNLYVQKDK